MSAEKENFWKLFQLFLDYSIDRHGQVEHKKWWEWLWKYIIARCNIGNLRNDNLN